MINVFYLDISSLQDEVLFEKMFNMVNEQRRQKVLRCKNKEDSLLSLGAELAFFYAVREMGLYYQELKIEISKMGKPSVKEIPNLEFSLSHTGQIAVCAISDKAIGVDIELKNRCDSWDEERCNRFKEKIASVQESSMDLITLWTRKESMLKAKGMGIFHSFNEITEVHENCFYTREIEEKYMLSIYSENLCMEACSIKKIDIEKDFFDI